MVLEAEWSCLFELNSMGQNLGQSYQDTIENTFEKMAFDKKYIFHTMLFESVDKKRFSKKLNGLKIIDLHLEKLLRSEIKPRLKKPQTIQYFDPTFKNNITPLLIEIGVNGLETYVTNFIQKRLKNVDTTKDIKYIRYVDEIYIISNDIEVLKSCILLIKNYLIKIGFKISNKETKISHSFEGSNFLGFQWISLKKANSLYTKLSISRESKQYILTKTRFIIQKNKFINPLFQK